MQAQEVRAPYVRFVRQPMEDREATLREKRYIAKDVDYALLSPIGSKDVIPRQADDYLEHLRQMAKEGRVPETWPARYEEQLKAWRAGQDPVPDGTPIRGWSVLSPAQQANVLGANVLTVEDLAQANDEARRRIGPGSLDLVEKAIAYLKAASGPGAAASEIGALKKEIKAQRAQMEELREQIAALRAENEDLARSAKAEA